MRSLFRHLIEVVVVYVGLVRIRSGCRNHCFPVWLHIMWQLHCNFCAIDVGQIACVGCYLLDLYTYGHRIEFRDSSYSNEISIKKRHLNKEYSCSILLDSFRRLNAPISCPSTPRRTSRWRSTNWIPRKSAWSWALVRNNQVRGRNGTLQELYRYRWICVLKRVEISLKCVVCTAIIERAERLKKTPIDRLTSG